MRSFRDSLPFRGILIVSLLFLPSYVLAAANSLEVQCVDRAGSAVSGAKVVVVNVQIPDKPKDKKSDKKGFLRFDKLDDGVYRVFSRQQGFSPALYEYVALKGDARQSIKLEFEQGADRPLYFENKELLQQAMEALKAGVEDLRAGKFADAENKIKTSLTVNPSNPEALLNLAIAYIQQRKWAEAEVPLKNADRICAALSQLVPPQGATGPSPYIQLGQNAAALLEKLPGLRLRTDASDNLAKKNYKEAAAGFQESLKHFPDDPDMYYNLALAQAQDKEFDTALQNIQKAITLKPAEKAYADLKTQIESLRENETVKKAQVILDQGEALLKNKDYAGAMQKYQEAKSMVPPKGQAVVLGRIANAEAQQNRPEEAIAAYKQAIELDPENPIYKQTLGQFYITQKRYDDALNLHAGSGGAGSDQALLSLGQRLYKQGNNQVAQLAFERAIKANPENAEAYYELGTILYFGKEDDKRAKEVLTKYVEIGKDQGHVDNAKNFLVVLEKRIKQ